MTTRLLAVGNWKMHLDYVEALHLTQQLGVLLKNRPPAHTDVTLAPPFVDLRSVASLVEADRLALSLAAQHVNPHENGPFTGEISTAMLTRLGVTSVIVGHSERRRHFGMGDDVVAATTDAVTRAGLGALVCVGEETATRDAGGAKAFVEGQLRRALEGLSESARDLVSVAYEPIWAIGTGVNATLDQVAEMTTHVRDVLGTLSIGGRVLYGGSVTATNASELLEAGIDGFLVGGASLRAESFAAIIGACDDCYALRR